MAIGFVGLFSNSLLCSACRSPSVPSDPDALTGNYAIVAIHSPFCYALGITAMEVVRGRREGAGLGIRATALRVLRAMFRNGLVIGITLGFAVNLTGFPLPAPVRDAIDLMVRAALPAALFGLGGVLYRYRPEGDLRTIGFICVVSLVLHPAVVWGLGRALGLSDAQFRSAVVTAAMAPGVNAYLFANLYGVARRVAASAVLVGTGASLVTVWVWLALLHRAT